MEMITFLVAPFIASLVLAGIHCYFGLHVVNRGIIFADLSMAQMAALGTAVGIFIGIEQPTASYFFSLGFAFLAGLLFTLVRFEKEKVPQEAIIGIVYGVSSAAVVLLFQKIPHGIEELEKILVGNILFVSWHEIIKIAVIYSAIGIIHYLFRRKFITLSSSPDKIGRKQRIFWDIIFFITFAVVVTSSVRLAGVLLVFSYLIIPSVAAMLFFHSIKARLTFGWIFGSLGSLIGIWFSAECDFPTGASIICALAALLVLCASVNKLMLEKK
jgi:zinc/manganese transport system permease protein